MGSGGSKSSGELKAEIEALIAKHAVVVFSKTYCGYCSHVKEMLGNQKISFHEVNLSKMSDTGAWQDTLQQMTGARSVPRVFVGGKSIGGCDDTVALQESGKLQSLVDAAKK